MTLISLRNSTEVYKRTARTTKSILWELLKIVSRCVGVCKPNNINSFGSGIFHGFDVNIDSVAVIRTQLTS